MCLTLIYGFMMPDMRVKVIEVAQRDPIFGILCVTISNCYKLVHRQDVRIIHTLWIKQIAQ